MGGDKMDESYATMDASAFFEALHNVHAVIDLTYSYDAANYDFEMFLTTFGLDGSSDLPFIRNQLVLRTDAQISGVSNLDWFESRLVHPDWAVLGLMRVLKPSSVPPEHEVKRYFRNIAIGEAVEVFHEDECTTKLVACEPSKYPSTLTMIDEFAKIFPDCDDLPPNVRCPDSAKQGKSKQTKTKRRRGKTEQKSGKNRKSRKSRRGKTTKNGKL